MNFSEEEKAATVAAEQGRATGYGLQQLSGAYGPISVSTVFV